MGAESCQPKQQMSPQWGQFMGVVHFRAEYEYTSNHNQEHPSRFPPNNRFQRGSNLSIVTGAKKVLKLYAFQTHWMHQIARQQLHGGGFCYRLQKNLTVPP